MPTRFVSRPEAVKPVDTPWPGAYRGGICPECRAEVADPQSRHFRDPFHNCRACGPGAAITRRLPFVRENTSYAAFEPCGECLREAARVDGRQSASASVSCPDCGPQYWIEPAPPPDSRGDLLYEVSRLLAAERVLALKDQRAFRLLARADRDAVVNRLRRRRGGLVLPVAIMVADLDAARQVAVLDPESERQLQCVSSPRVLVPVRDGAPLAEELKAAGEVELMLAPEAVYQILFADLDEGSPVPLLVSGTQIGREVAVRENEEARGILRDVADFLVLHDLELFPCTEDWVLRVVDEAPVVLRRSGADTDCPLPLAPGAPQVLGLGCGSEATAAAAVGPCIRIGPYVGELETDRSVEQFAGSARRLLKLFDGHPAWVAYDPQSKERLRPILDALEARPVAVDHHHAHVAAVMAEHGILGPVVGLALDGEAPIVHPGFGRAVVLYGTAADTRVVEALPAFRIPAANLAGRDAWRTSLGLIHDLLGRGAARDWARQRAGSPEATGSALSMLEHGVDCTRVESFGRILCGLAELVRNGPERGPQSTCGLSRIAGPVRDLDPGSLPDPGLRPDALLAGILTEVLRRGRERRPAAETAAWALTALGRGVGFRVAARAREAGVDTVVAGGGSLADPWVRHVLRRTLEQEGLELFLNDRMPCGDAAIALGQVWSVLAREG